MTNIEAKRIIALGKTNNLKVLSRQDPELPNQRLAIINGFYYDDASIAVSDIVNHEFD